MTTKGGDCTNMATTPDNDLLHQASGLVIVAVTY